MSDIDWTRRRGADLIVCQMVSPVSRDEVWGELPLSDGGSVSQGYYSDTRASASVLTDAWDQYVPGAWLRLVHQVAGTSYARTLFTGFPTSAAPSLSSGIKSVQVELKSALYALDVERQAPVLTVGAGTSVRRALQGVCDASRPPKPCHFEADFNDGTLAATRAYTSEKSLREILFDLADAGGDRVDVDERGVVTFARYLAPSLRTPSFALSASHPLVIAGSVSGAVGTLGLPNRSIATWKNGEEELSASADLDSGHARSAMRTGVTWAELHDLTEAPDPPTLARVEEMARSYLAQDSLGTDEWTLTTLWWEARAGMVGTFDPGDGGGSRKVLLKNVDSDITARSMTHVITLKEV